MNSLRTAALALGFGLTLAGAASAQAPPPPPGGGGALFVSPMGEPFRSHDRATAPIRIWFAAADADGDGRLTREEFVGQAMSFFANTLDANHDRAATSAESTELWRERAPEMLARRTAPISVSSQRPPNEMGSRGPQGGANRRREPRDQGPPPGAQPIMLGTELEPVMSCDADRSRRVDIMEFERCATRRFIALDVNGDGVFTIEESERARELAETGPRPVD